MKMAPVGEEAGERPLKVAIAGGGVGGLTTAFYMLKSGVLKIEAIVDIKEFNKHPVAAKNRWEK